MENFDLNRPAFGPNAQKVEETTTESVDEVVKEEAPAQSEEESKVPYSRFKKFHDEAKQYQQEAEYWRQQAEAPRPERHESFGQDPLAEARRLFIENYGDSEATHRAWDNQVKISQTLQAQAVESAKYEALEAIKNERYQEVQRTQDNIQTIDNELEALTDYVGRNLTTKEEEAILDIVDEFTPKDNYGNYAGSLLPMDRAWEIYELKQGAMTSGKRTSRDNIASLSASQSQGNSDVQSEQDKHFNPSWGALDSAIKKRLGQ